MGQDSKIEWTHHTFNPWWGCAKVSPGCTNCYAETLDRRIGGSHWGIIAPRKTFTEKHWREPLKWDAAAGQAGERHRVFCASMADVFDSQAPDGLLDRLWELIRQTSHMDWLLLTKRADHVADSLPPDWGQGYPNVWLGVTVENQDMADYRVPILMSIPAVVRFLSCEPLLGPVNLREFAHQEDWHVDALDPPDPAHRIHWVIVGGESGPDARPMNPDWARSLRDQCQTAGVAFHFKQWGEWAPAEHLYDTIHCRLIDRSGKLDEVYSGWGLAQARDGLEIIRRFGKKSAGRELDGRTWDEFPQVAKA